MTPEIKSTSSATQTPTLSAEVWVSTLLRYGVATSISVVLLGTLLSFLRHPEYASSVAALSALTHPTSTAHSFSELWARSAASPGQTVVMFGLLLLIGLPVARVGLSLWLFRLSGDKTYVKLTAAVLVLLAVSFLVGALH
jgi:uncharacterized membrane protein